DRIDVLAKQKVVLRAGRTEVVLEGRDVTFACPGTFTVKAGQVPLGSPQTGTTPPTPATIAGL
ncbi:DUF2345 domain-containing protein, partial [Bacillus tequilensis]|nr:DUF2345 domain-containing protein [Bacillus tequilensis]